LKFQESLYLKNLDEEIIMMMMIKSKILKTQDLEILVKNKIDEEIMIMMIKIIKIEILNMKEKKGHHLMNIKEKEYHLVQMEKKWK